MSAPGSPPAWREQVRLEVEQLAEGLTRVLFGDYDTVLAARGADPLFGQLAMLGNVVINSARNALAERERLATEAQSRARDLAAGRDRLQAILDASEDGLLFLEADGRVAFMSARFQDLLASALPGLLPLTAAALEAGLAELRPDPPDAFARLLRPSGACPERHQAVFRVGWPARRVLSGLCLPVGTPGGETAGRLLVLRDVTVVEETRRFREELLGNVAHEIRTPLTSICGYLELLAGGHLGPLEARQSEALRTVLRGATRLGELVGDLLDVDRIEHVSTAREPVELAPLLAEVIEHERPRAARKGLQIVADLQPGLRALGDRRLLHQVARNLLSNAVKYTANGGATVRTLAEAGTAVLEVADTGIGIPPAELARVFERFHRGDDPRVRATAGTGIGLSIVRRFVEISGGAIEVDSRVGAGSRFRVRLPAAD